MRRFAPLLALLACCGPGAGLVAAPTTAKVEPSAPVAPLESKVAAPPADSEEDAPVPISLDDPTWGSRFAPVTIVEFEDFQCPFCARVAPQLDALRQEYGKDRLRIVWKNMPLAFHPQARPAAEAAMGVHALAGNDGFWAYHDLLFHNQHQLGRASIVELAKVAVDATRLMQGLDSGEWTARVERDITLAKRLNVNGTPTFFVNGVSLMGAQPIDKFREAINEQTKLAETMLQQGVARGALYKTISRENRARAATDDLDP